MADDIEPSPIEIDCRARAVERFDDEAVAIIG